MAAQGINVPDDCTFAYVVLSEGWYAEAIDRPEMSVQLVNHAGGVNWEFVIVQKHHGQSCIQVRIFDEAFAAFGQIPAFFDALRDEQPRTVEAVRKILDRLGAIDRTDREKPAYLSTPGEA
jgi:hypothetical protein